MAALCCVLSEGSSSYGGVTSSMAGSGHNPGKTSGLLADELSIDSLYSYFLKYFDGGGNSSSSSNSGGGSSGSGQHDSKEGNGKAAATAPVGGEWNDLVACWDKRLAEVAPELSSGGKGGGGHGWVKRLFEAVAVVGRKPLEVEVDIKEIDITLNVKESINLWSTVRKKASTWMMGRFFLYYIFFMALLLASFWFQIFLKRVRAMVKRAKDLKLPHINFQTPEKIL